MIRTAARIVAIAAISISAMGLAGTAFADEDPNAGGAVETSQTTETPAETPADETAAEAPVAAPAGTLPEACTLLPAELAAQTIDNRTPLTLTSTSGGVECLYQATDNSGSYAVDLDISEQTGDSLDKARYAWSSPGVEIADATGLGEGAFTGLNNQIDAIVVCAKDGIQYDIEVYAPEAAFAQQQVLTLGQLYCGTEAPAAS